MAKNIGTAWPKFPGIDCRVRLAGISSLRGLSADKLQGLEEIVIVQAGSEPLAVLVPYQQFLHLQARLTALSAAPK